MEEMSLAGATEISLVFSNYDLDENKIIEELPDEVWESVRAGAPLAASYALYERKKAAKAKRVAEINQKNASRSPGAAGTDTASEYFTPDEVRRMSRAEVHANYSKIKESMKKWMQK